MNRITKRDMSVRAEVDGWLTSEVRIRLGRVVFQLGFKAFTALVVKCRTRVPLRPRQAEEPGAGGEVDRHSLPAIHDLAPQHR